MAQRLVATLEGLPGVELTSVLVTNEDYARYPAPALTRASDPWVSQYLAREKAKPVRTGRFDALWVNCWEFAVEFRDIARAVPAAAVLDAVPSTIDAQLRSRGVGGWKRVLSYAVHNDAFRRAAPDFEFFLPLGSDCAGALQRNYGIPGESCFITLAPQDTQQWVPAPKRYQRPLRLLFAGNDFARKGGAFLISLIRDHLDPADFHLTIASNDASLETVPLPTGVEWLRGRNRDQLRDVYANSHLFVFPTLQDYMPQVLAEAMTMGLPCIANDIGGIRDIVQEGETGFLMHPSDKPERWAARLKQLASEPDRLSRMSAAARLFAETRLDISVFRSLVAGIVDAMRGARSGSTAGR